MNQVKKNLLSFGPFSFFKEHGSGAWYLMPFMLYSIKAKAQKQTIFVILFYVQAQGLKSHIFTEKRLSFVSHIHV